MNVQQIAQEIRDLNDKTDRLEASIDTLGTRLGQMRDRDIPASTAQISHTLSGSMKIVADLAGTVQSLGITLFNISDRLTVLERVIDDELPPEVRPL